jgi:Holliday junction resolvase RusA-like endonuclease
MSTVTFYQNPFYDDVFGTFDVTIPSKRIRYKQDDNKRITEIITPKGSQEFETYIKQVFNSDTNENWPYKCELLIAISILLPIKEWKIKDIDNLAKSIVDALKGIVYEDDNQITSLFISKTKSDQPSFMVGVKCLKEEDSVWFVPLLYSEKPWE